MKETLDLDNNEFTYLSGLLKVRTSKSFSRDMFPFKGVVFQYQLDRQVLHLVPKWL